MTELSTFLPTVDELKAQAKRLRTELGKAGGDIRHGAALELVAKQYGFRDWNTLCAEAKSHAPPCPYRIGQRVSGRYLGQPFTARIHGVDRRGANRYRVRFDLDEPVDVVTFDSFSAFRKRIVCTIDPRGRTVEKTSNGRPHMELTQA
jgi:hypothetical protein